MKRTLSLILAVIMVVLSVPMTAGEVAAYTDNVVCSGTLIHSDDFNTSFSQRNWYTDDSCTFMWDKENGCVHGYSDAIVLQTRYTAPYNRKWDKFYASYDFQIRADDDATEIGETPDTSVALWYRDQFDVENVPSAVYMFNINVQTGEAELNKSVSYTYKNENGITKKFSIDEAIATGNINDKIEVGEDAKWFNIGMRVDLGKIECYYNEQLIFSLEANENDEKIGGVALHNVDATVGTQKSPILFWNIGNWIAVDNFEVWSVDYSNHEFVQHEGKEPTCEETGYLAYETCRNCDYSTYEEFPASGHTLALADAKAPTCTEIGWEAYEYCTLCDYSTYAEIPVRHNNTSVLGYVAPTCTTTGFTGSIFCRDCKTTVENSQTIPATGHQYENGFCISCGEKEPTDSIPGDSNGDGTVDGADLQLLQRAIAGLSAEMDETAADANSDGSIDGADAMYISRLIAGLSV